MKHIEIRSKKGSYIMEAAVVLPMVIFVTITSVLIIMFFYNQMTERCRLHMALRYEAAEMTEYTAYTSHSEICRKTDAEIYSNKKVIGGEVYGKKYLIMSHRGILDKKGTFVVQGNSYVVDGVKYVRYCNTVKGAADVKAE